ncbi:hypothetical protein MCHI_000356 [Candidatus Magnetoovum chiemensis]|jgi:hypothetical protein|nr:hypothetical protein MCHI_000356 [Candidatus Magnetoovum chiemensis]|tara:strand:+ start:494 stop:640 length:147 start_codon:yes stop_codon:yes gene_type:complete
MAEIQENKHKRLIKKEKYNKIRYTKSSFFSQATDYSKIWGAFPQSYPQ